MSESDRERRRRRSGGIRVTVRLYHDDGGSESGGGAGGDSLDTASRSPGRRKPRHVTFVPTDVDFATLLNLIASRLGLSVPEPASGRKGGEEHSPHSHHDVRDTDGVQSTVSGTDGVAETTNDDTTTDDDDAAVAASRRTSWRLLLGGDAVLEDVSEIDDGDELVLDTGGGAVAAATAAAATAANAGSGPDADTSSDESGASGSADVDGAAFSSDSSVVDVTDKYRPPPRSSSDDDDDDDDDEVEDVTEEYQMAAEEERRRKLEGAELLEDDDDDDDDEEDERSIGRSSESEGERSEPECIVLSSDDDDDDESWSEGESRHRKRKKQERQQTKPKRATKKRRRKSGRPAEPTIEVLIDEGDVPNMPGAKGGGADDADSDGRTGEDGGDCDNDNVDASVKDRVIKLLNTGFHSNSNEHEARNALKLARRLMARHNLSQALLLRERDGRIRSDGAMADDGSPLRGGLVTVRIVKRADRQPLSSLVRWNDRLIHPVCENFQVEAYKTVRRKRRWREAECSVTFYGIYDNAQLAAYAFKIATERIASMAATFVPVNCARKSASSTERATATRVARLSYALGIVEGLTRDVEENKRREEQRREERLKRARNAASKGEAYEESDREDDGGWSDLDGGEFDAPPSAEVTEVSGSSRADSLDKALDTAATPQDAKVVVEKLEREESAALALVQHHKRISENVLKEKNIKVRNGRKRRSIAFDRTAYDKGVEDAKEIDLNQRALRD